MDLLSQAHPALARAVELLPEGKDRVEARIRLASLYVAYLQNAYFEKPVADEATRLANELIALDPKSYDGFRIRGKVATLDAGDIARRLPSVAKERLQAAISDLRAADAIRPYEADSLTTLARCLWASGQPSEAEKYLLLAIAYHKERLHSGVERSVRDLDAAYDQLYNLYLSTGRAGDAETTLKQAIETQRVDQGRMAFAPSLPNCSKAPAGVRR